MIFPSEDDGTFYQTLLTLKSMIGKNKRGSPMWQPGRTLNIVSIPLDEIQPNIYQPRKDFNDNTLDDLTNSIKSYGVYTYCSREAAVRDMRL